MDLEDLLIASKKLAAAVDNYLEHRGNYADLVDALHNFEEIVKEKP